MNEIESDDKRVHDLELKIAELRSELSTIIQKQTALRMKKHLKSDAFSVCLIIRNYSHGGIDQVDFQNLNDFIQFINFLLEVKNESAK